ncbi:MAG: preprotein translocase subunit SecE [Bryobacterales bacterium]|nr:preprotein translocase subunit SecE [Bryobacterales bacterium]
MAEVVSKSAPMDGGKPLAGLQAWPARVKEYVGDLQSEMRRVSWPTREQVQTTTIVVIITVFLFAAYFWAVDLVLGRAITRLFDMLTQK